jgi:hypothetical protein
MACEQDKRKQPNDNGSAELWKLYRVSPEDQGKALAHKKAPLVRQGSGG